MGCIVSKVFFYFFIFYFYKAPKQTVIGFNDMSLVVFEIISHRILATRMT